MMDTVTAMRRIKQRAPPTPPMIGHMSAADGVGEVVLEVVAMVGVVGEALSKEGITHNEQMVEG